MLEEDVAVIGLMGEERTNVALVCDEIKQVLIGVTILEVFSLRIDPTMAAGEDGRAALGLASIGLLPWMKEECLDNSMSIDVAEDFMRRAKEYIVVARVSFERGFTTPRRLMPR
ncbi:hypothetical protein [Vulcanisaeta sp. JCM 16159]|uniref:hypothetical protein n=1 Tax=Vulcanisaeta sp. JCM 16159 TaxID=1295371 RepID=UPI000B2B4D16|nr:hypothetical protein [Vulcanisaeta sp. JCM 16159]